MFAAVRVVGQQQDAAGGGEHKNHTDLCLLNIGPLLFYFMFALAVTASVQQVGVYLVFASLIIPALATRQYSGKQRLLAGYGTGIAGYAIGLVLSTLFDLPSGAIVVWCMTAVAVVIFVLSRRLGAKHS